MKTVFIGAGHGCRDVLRLMSQGRLGFLDIQLAAVADIDPGAPGLEEARLQGSTVFHSIREALALPEIDLVVELTGREEVLKEIQRHIRPGIRVMDHVLARVFWDLDRVVQNLEDQLEWRTATQTMLEEERARVQEILDVVPDMVMVLDENMKIVRVNRRFEQDMGLTRQQVEDMYCYEAICMSRHPERCARDDCVYYEVFETGRPVNLVRHARSKDHGEDYFQVTAAPIYNEKGRIVRVVETSREITESVLLKRETEESARRFQQILEAVHAMITIKDPEGRYQLVNPYAAQLFGKTCDEMIGKKDVELFPAPVAAKLRSADEIVLKNGEPHVEVLELPFGGRERTLVNETFPIADYKGDRVAVCNVARDDTHREELQREVLRSERLAAVGRLAAGVAHELNNPLTGILAFVEDLLHDADKDDPRREDYEVILNETMRCRRIVRDLLDFSRQKAPERRRVDINTVICRTVKMLSHQATFQDVVIEVSLAEGLPQVSIDANQIQQAILNLVVNGRDAITGPGHIDVGSCLDAARNLVAVAVSDDGCGIPEERLKDVFKPFFSTKGDQGIGLGLSAVESIISQHGGAITVQSRVGVGTTFRFTLPVPGA